jgi:cytochrome c peroxidase
MPEDSGGNAKAQQSTELIPGAARYIQSPQKKTEEKSQEQHTAHETPLFSQNGEDEISVVLRNEAELALGSFEKSFSPELSRTNSYLRLNYVVPGPERISAGIE